MSLFFTKIFLLLKKTNHNEKKQKTQSYMQVEKKRYSWFCEPLPFPSFLEHKLYYAERVVEKYCKVVTYPALMIHNTHHFLWI